MLTFTNAAEQAAWTLAEALSEKAFAAMKQAEEAAEAFRQGKMATRRQFKARGIKPVLTATGQLTASSLLLLPIALLADRPWLLPFPGPTVSMAILAAAALSTALGYLLYFRILGSAGATNVLLVTFLIPVSAVLRSRYLRSGG